MRALLLGAGGTLGTELQKQLQHRSFEYSAFDRELDITDPAQINAKIAELRPELIFNCAAYNSVDQAEDHPEEAMRLNADAVGYIADAAKRFGAAVLHYSSGFVFDGENPNGYSETDQPNPQSAYARSKFRGEQVLQASGADYYLVRLNLLFGAAGQGAGSKKSFPALILEQAKDKLDFDFVDDEISTPTYAPDLAAASIALAEQKLPFGIYHIVNEGRASWYDWAREIFALQGVPARLNPVSAGSFPRKAARPKCSVLINNKLPKLRSWQQATAEFLKNQR